MVVLVKEEEWEKWEEDEEEKFVFMNYAPD